MRTESALQLRAAIIIALLLSSCLALASVAPAVADAVNPDGTTITTTTTSATETSENTSAGPPALPIACGYHYQNGSRVVAASPAGAAVTVTVGEPSWLQVCNTVSSGSVSSSESFVAYEVFPITIQAAPGTALSLKVGSATFSPQQVAMGLQSNTIWTGFDPINVTTDSNGVASSNFTLAGAVMPFVPNDISNVSLPITAQSSGGRGASAGLPIEFSGSEGGFGDVIHIFRTPGPIVFPGTMQGSPGNSMQYAYGIVYAPSGSVNSAPVDVSLRVAGSWNGGAVGPLPQEIQASIVQSTFRLEPNQVFYFWVDVNNTIAPSNVPAGNGYTFAVQEKVGNDTYLEPLSVSISTGDLFGSFGAFGATSPQASVGMPWNLGFGGLAVLSVGIAAVALALVLLAVRRKAARKSTEVLPPLPGQTDSQT